MSNRLKIFGLILILLVLIIVIYHFNSNKVKKGEEANLEYETTIVGNRTIKSRYNELTLMYEFLDEDGIVILSIPDETSYHYYLEQPELIFASQENWVEMDNDTDSSLVTH